MPEKIDDSEKFDPSLRYQDNPLTPEELAEFEALGGMEAYRTFIPKTPDFEKYRELYLRHTKAIMSENEDFPYMTKTEEKQFKRLRYDPIYDGYPSHYTEEDWATLNFVKVLAFYTPK